MVESRRPILPPLYSVNQTNWPSMARPAGPPLGVGTSYSVNAPVVGSSLPILLPLYSLNQKLPLSSTSRHSMFAAGVVVSVYCLSTTPLVFMTPILLTPGSLNQRLPSGPTVMSCGMLSGDGRANCVTTPEGVTRAMASPSYSHIQTLPSGPSVSERSAGAPVGRE